MFLIINKIVDIGVWDGRDRVVCFCGRVDVVYLAGGRGRDRVSFE